MDSEALLSFEKSLNQRLWAAQYKQKETASRHDDFGTFPTLFAVLAHPTSFSKNVARRLLGATPQAREIWQSLLIYTGVINQTFVRIAAVGWGVSILLWSVSILKNRALARGVGAYGILLGPAMIVAIISGLRLKVHGIGSVVILGPAIWFLVVGAMLIRRGD